MAFCVGPEVGLHVNHVPLERREGHYLHVLRMHCMIGVRLSRFPDPEDRPSLGMLGVDEVVIL